MLLINLVGFVLFGLDKFKAKLGMWRVSENTLLMITLLGGFVGSLFGMIFFSHKTTKGSFQIRFRLIIFLRIIISIIYMFFF